MLGKGVDRMLRYLRKSEGDYCCNNVLPCNCMLLFFVVLFFFSKLGLLLKERICSRGEPILSFNSSP